MFKNSSLGLDISDESIKFIELFKTPNGFQVSRYRERKIPTGVIESGKIRDTKKMQEILSLFKKKENLKSVHVSLPYELLDEQKQGIKDYLSAFRNSTISVKSFELEAEAIARAVIKKDDPETYMIVDFNKNRAGIFIVLRNEVLSISVLEFDENKPFNIFKEDLKNEIARRFVYWHTHKDEKGKSKPPVKKIIVCGENSNIFQLSEYLSSALRSKVELANVWINILDTEKNIPEINFQESFKFTPALGVALKDF